MNQFSYEILYIIISFIPIENQFNFRLINRTFYKIYESYYEIRKKLDPTKHMLYCFDDIHIPPKLFSFISVKKCQKKYTLNF